MAEIGFKVHLDYDQILTIIRNLFDQKNNYAKKILALDIREFYSFTLNNTGLLKHAIRAFMSSEIKFTTVNPSRIRQVEFFLPQTALFTYDSKNKSQVIYEKMFMKTTSVQRNHDPRRKKNLKNILKKQNPSSGFTETATKAMSIFPWSTMIP